MESCVIKLELNLLGYCCFAPIKLIALANNLACSQRYSPIKSSAKKVNFDGKLVLTSVELTSVMSFIDMLIYYSLIFFEDINILDGDRVVFKCAVRIGAKDTLIQAS